MAAERPNFYQLLELDPTEDDWSVIEPRLRAKREQWARERTQGNPKAKRRAEATLPLLPEIEALLRDPARRRQEAAAAAKLRTEQRARDLAELDEVAALLRSGGGVCDAEAWKRLVQQFAGRLAEAEISARLTAAGVKLVDPASERPQPVPLPELDKNLVRTLQHNLEHLGKASLYEVLGLRPQSSPRALLDRARELYSESLQKGKVDADAAALNELVGVASRIFANDETKARYDRYLALAVLEELKPKLEIVGSDGFLAREEVATLLQQARQRGVEAAEALRFIEGYAAQRKWKVQPASAGPAPPEPQLCGFCSALSPPGVARCSSCGEPLRLACPRCGSENPSAQAACGSCGARVGDAPRVHELVRHGEELALAGKLREARAALEQALLLWPDWPRARAAKQRVEERQALREQQLASLESAVVARRLHAAQGALERFEREHGGAGLDGLRGRIAQGLQQAQQAFEAGERLRRQGGAAALEGALERFEEALAYSLDHPAALAALAASPPPPPERLDVVPTPAGFRLSWVPPPTRRALRYRVVRKARSLPTGPGDGESVAEVAAPSCEDVGAKVGTPWCWAVFSVRGETTSLLAAQSGPHLRLGEVERLEAVPGEGTVLLRWSPPPGCLRVEVLRAVGRPPAVGEPAVSVVATAAEALDSGLTNGQVWGYRVVAVYADPVRPGQEVRSTGCTLLARPEAPPQPVDDLVAERVDELVLLRWKPTPSGEVELRVLRSRPAMRAGSVLALAEARQLGEALPSLTRGEARFRPSASGRYFFVPFTVREQAATAGRVAEVAFVDPVTEVSIRRTPGAVALTWKWPPTADRAIVAWAAERHPERADGGSGRRQEVRRADYEREGCWRLPVTGAKEALYVAVFACASEPGLFAPPARAFDAGGSLATVRYQVATERGLFSRSPKAAWLELSTSDAVPRLPALVVVGKPQDVPLSARDGQVLLELEGVELNGGRARVPLTPPASTVSLFVRVFFRDSALSQTVRLLPGAREHLRLG